MIKKPSTAQPIAQPTQNGISPLHEYVTKALEHYFIHLGDHQPIDLYNLVIKAVEQPLFKAIMTYCDDNQTLAANALGISRSTLRKKLKCYNLLKPNVS